MTLALSFETIQDMVAAAAEGCKPADRLTVAEAAALYRKLRNQHAYVGPWLNETTPYLVEPMNLLNSTMYTGMIFVGPAQCGKALALDTAIPTPSGWTTMGALRVGDVVFGSDGKPCRVTAATEIQHGRECFEITFGNGEKVVADADHNWFCTSYRDGRDAARVRTTREIKQRGRPVVVPVAKPLDLPAAELPLDPYVLGAWLGDGHSYGARIYASPEDAAEMQRNLGIETRMHVDGKGLAVIALSAKRHAPGREGGSAGVSAALRSLSLSRGELKFVPGQYLRASEEQRVALLQGLMDTDGTIDKRGRCEFTTKHEKFADGFCELLVGLGYSYRRRVRTIQGRDYQYIAFSPRGVETLFRLGRKQARVERAVRRPIRQAQTAMLTIEPTRSVPVRCITVDSPDHLYVVGRRHVVTHNTDMFLNWLTFTVIVDPADMLLVEKIQASARDFSIRRVDRLHRETPEVRQRLIDRRNADNTHDKRYSSGMLLTISWPTINELSGRSIPRVWFSDYDRMTQDVDGEGSPYDLGKKRATIFQSNGMTVAESSPGFILSNPKWIGKSRHEAPPTEGVLKLYNRGDRRRWYWKCVNCLEAFEPDFSLLSYPAPSERVSIVEASEAVVMICPHCAQRYAHDPVDDLPGKHELNLNGRWLMDGETWRRDGSISGHGSRSDIGSFWLKGPAATFTTWKELVAKFLTAEKEYSETGSEEGLKTTVNTDQGLPYTPKAIAESRMPETIKARAKDYDQYKVPTGVRFLVACIDVQKHRFEVQVHGIGEGGDVWIIDRYKVLKSRRLDKDDDRWLVNPGAYFEDWKLLVDEVMAKSYELIDGSGRRMAIKMTLCDSGGREGVTSNAYKFVRWLRFGDNMRLEPDEKSVQEEGEYTWQAGYDKRFTLVKGEAKEGAPRVKLGYPDSQRKDRHAGARGEIPVLFLNSNSLKDSVNGMLDRTESGGGRVNFPNWLPDWFYTELTVEVKDPKKNVWVNPNNARNEAWDLLVYAYAATLMPGIGLEHINWTDPPKWAAEWDRNDLVFAAAGKKPFEQQAKPDYGSLRALGEALA